MKITSKIIAAAFVAVAALGLVSCEKKQVLKLYSWTYYTPMAIALRKGLKTFAAGH